MKRGGEGGGGRGGEGRDGKCWVMMLLYLHRFDEEEEAIALANDTPFGLAGALP